MQARFTKQQFEKAKSGDLLPLTCKGCTTVFYRSKKRIQDTQRASRTHDTADYCSIQCCNAGRDTTREFQCNQCGTTFRRNRTQSSKSVRQFCGSPCAATYNNTHKTHGTRVSKLEKWIQERLAEFYPQIEWHHNRKDAISGELDIYSPALKLAFELDGVFHFKPIFGADKLARIQANDLLKAEACRLQGIDLHRVNVSSLKYFRVDRAQPYLDTICAVIDQRLNASIAA